MKAVLLDRPCSAEELKTSEIPIPEVRKGWVLVKIHAAGLNHSEALLRMFEIENDYIQKPIVPGIECVGEIADPSDSHFAKGDKIIALMGGMGRSFNGSYAEYALLPATNVFKVETDLDWVSLAAMSFISTTWGFSARISSILVFSPLCTSGSSSTVGG